MRRKNRWHRSMGAVIGALVGVILVILTEILFRVSLRSDTTYAWYIDVYHTLRLANIMVPLVEWLPILVSYVGTIVIYTVIGAIIGALIDNVHALYHGTHGEKGRGSYIGAGIAGFFKLIWIGLQYIGLYSYWLASSLGKGIHRLSQKAHSPFSRNTDDALEFSEKDSKKSPASTEFSAPRSSISKQRSGDFPAHHEELIPTTDLDRFVAFAQSLYSKSQITLIFGKRGSGKSTLGFRIMENAHALNKRPCFVLGVNQELLPSWIHEVQDIDHVHNGGIVLVDEGAIAFSSRQSMKTSNVELGKILAIARHKDLALLFITQNTGMIDKNVLNLTDIIIAKEGSLLQKKMERTEVREFVEKADKEIKKLNTDEHIAHAYIFGDEYEGLVKIPLPSFWSQKISKSRA